MFVVLATLNLGTLSAFMELPPLTREEIIEYYNSGIRNKATHMIWYSDPYSFPYEDFVRFVYASDDIKTVIDQMKKEEGLSIMAVFAMHLDIYEQLKEGPPFHTEYENTP